MKRSIMKRYRGLGRTSTSDWQNKKTVTSCRSFISWRLLFFVFRGLRGFLEKVSLSTIEGITR